MLVVMWISFTVIRWIMLRILFVNVVFSFVLCVVNGSHVAIMLALYIATYSYFMNKFFLKKRVLRLTLQILIK